MTRSLVRFQVRPPKNFKKFTIPVEPEEGEQSLIRQRSMVRFHPHPPENLKCMIKLNVKKPAFAKAMAGRRKTKKPLIVAMVGLVGSGKSTIAAEIAKNIGAVLIDADEIRVQLRKMGKGDDTVRQIAEAVAGEMIKRGRNVVLTSDFIDAQKRSTLEKKAKQFGVRVIYIRTFCDRDVMIGRIVSARYNNDVNDFFGGASTTRRGNQKYRGAIVKLREMWRRTPHHYRWVDKGGGAWVLKKLPIRFFADIDTTNPKKWRTEVKRIAQKLKILTNKVSRSTNG